MNVNMIVVKKIVDNLMRKQVFFFRASVASGCDVGDFGYVEFLSGLLPVSRTPK